MKNGNILIIFYTQISALVAKIRKESLMGDVLNGEFENSTKCEHRICLDKCSMG